MHTLNKAVNAFDTAGADRVIGKAPPSTTQNRWVKGLSHQTDMTHNKAAAAQETQRRLDIFTPAFQRLVTVVAHQVQYPPDHQQWHVDEVQDFKQARYAIAEALEDAAGKASTMQYNSQVTK